MLFIMRPVYGDVYKRQPGYFTTSLVRIISNPTYTSMFTGIRRWVSRTFFFFSAKLWLWSSIQLDTCFENWLSLLCASSVPHATCYVALPLCHPHSLRAVSYTHLDVYKRQAWVWRQNIGVWFCNKHSRFGWLTRGSTRVNNDCMENMIF